MSGLYNAVRLLWLANAATAVRSAYLATIIAVAVVTWIGLTTLAAPFVQPRVATKLGGVIVTSANRGTALPIRYAKRLETIPGVSYLTYQTALVVHCSDTSPPISINAVGGPGIETTRFDKNRISARDKNAWMSDPLGVLVGRKAAKSCGWHPGMTISPRNMFTGQPVELHITAIRPQQINPLANDVVIAHYEYINRLKPKGADRDEVGGFAVAGSDARMAPLLAARIETAFAHDFPPVAAHTTVEVQNALQRYGKAQYALGYVMAAVFLCAALVWVSVLAHAAAQQHRQMALLKVLGFGIPSLFGRFMLESLTVLIAGAVVGTGIGLLVLNLLPATLGQFFRGFAVPAWTWWGLPVWLAGLWIVALILPFIAVRRVRPTDVRVA